MIFHAVGTLGGRETNYSITSAEGSKTVVNASGGKDQGIAHASGEVIEELPTETATHGVNSPLSFATGQAQLPTSVASDPPRPIYTGTTTEDYPTSAAAAGQETWTLMHATSQPFSSSMATSDGDNNTSSFASIPGRSIHATTSDENGEMPSRYSSYHMGDQADVVLGTSSSLVDATEGATEMPLLSLSQEGVEEDGEEEVGISFT